MSRGDVRIGAELIGIDRINRLVADLQEIDRNKAIKAGLRKGAEVFIRIGRSNLKARNKQKEEVIMCGIIGIVSSKNVVPYLITPEEAATQRKFFDYLMNEANRGYTNIFFDSDEDEIIPKKPGEFARRYRAGS